MSDTELTFGPFVYRALALCEEFRASKQNGRLLTLKGEMHEGNCTPETYSKLEQEAEELTMKSAEAIHRFFPVFRDVLGADNKFSLELGLCASYREQEADEDYWKQNNVRYGVEMRLEGNGLEARYFVGSEHGLNAYQFVTVVTPPNARHAKEGMGLTPENFERDILNMLREGIKRRQRRKTAHL